MVVVAVLPVLDRRLVQLAVALSHGHVVQDVPVDGGEEEEEEEEEVGEEVEEEEEEDRKRTGGGGGGGPVDCELLGGAAERTKHRAGGEGGAGVGEGADPLDQGHGGQQVAQQLLHEPLVLGLEGQVGEVEGGHLIQTRLEEGWAVVIDLKVYL